MYRGLISVRKEEVEDLLKAAETLQVKGLLKYRDSLEGVSAKRRGETQAHTDHSYHLPIADSTNSGSAVAVRTQFTDLQVKVLREYFEKNPFPGNVEYLSQQLGLSPRVIVVWFQNARQKERKKMKKQARQYQCEHCMEEFHTYLDLIIHQVQPCLEQEKEEEGQEKCQSITASTRSDPDPGADIVLSDQLEQLLEDFEQFSETLTNSDVSAENLLKRDENQNRKPRNGGSLYETEDCEPGSLVIEESQETLRSPPDTTQDSSALLRIVNVETLRDAEWNSATAEDSVVAVEEVQHGKGLQQFDYNLSQLLAF